MKTIYLAGGCFWGTQKFFLWLIFGGLLSGLSWIFSGVLWCITIIGIPYGKQCFKFASLSFCPFGKQFFKLAKLSLTPFGAQIISK